MPVCLEYSSALIISATPPADISQCAYIAMTGSEYSAIQVLIESQQTPYDAQMGAGIFGACFIFTLGLYISVRSMAEIAKHVKKVSRS